ncbi:head GIN domain-containing protein [Pedobacter ureilyticus]|uniref:Head GIN domain-containing protein n=1 Tax=Pedobacter ureilyticus TaxID=1393051 RepID=A0ABW9J567_9SPHI|nr:head GIN domain-containing protein [Pedobacter helvus]
MKNSFLSKISSLFIACIITLNVAAQSSKTVNAKNFTNIAVSNGIDLFITQGNAESVVVKGQEEVIKDVIVLQEGSNLTIKYKEGINWSRLFKGTQIHVYVTVKKLNGIAASGGSDVETQNTINTDKMSIKSSGGADLDLNIVCKDISISSSGGSDINLKGSAENMVLNTSGGSDVDAFDFKVNYAQVNTSGGSDANIYVNKGLTASATGGSDISYKGNAALKKVSNSKSADITHVN